MHVPVVMIQWGEGCKRNTVLFSVLRRKLSYSFRDGENEIRFEKIVGILFVLCLFLAFLVSSPTLPQLSLVFLGPLILHHITLFIPVTLEYLYLDWFKSH